MTELSVEAAVAARLKATAGLTALVGSRIFPSALPTDISAFPALTYSRVPGFARYSAMGGDMPSVCARIQVSIWGKKYGDAKDAQREARKALQRFSGVSAGTTIEDIYIDSEGDLPREPETGLYHCPLDLLVWYRES